MFFLIQIDHRIWSESIDRVSKNKQNKQQISIKFTDLIMLQKEYTQ